MPEDIDISFDDYNDICTECNEHAKCHKNGIDYEKIAKCKEEITNGLGLK